MDSACGVWSPQKNYRENHGIPSSIKFTVTVPAQHSSLNPHSKVEFLSLTKNFRILYATSKQVDRIYNPIFAKIIPSRFEIQRRTITGHQKYLFEIFNREYFMRIFTKITIDNDN